MCGKKAAASVGIDCEDAFQPAVAAMSMMFINPTEYSVYSTNYLSIAKVQMSNIN